MRVRWRGRTYVLFHGTSDRRDRERGSRAAGLNLERAIEFAQAFPHPGDTYPGFRSSFTNLLQQRSHRGVNLLRAGQERLLTGYAVSRGNKHGGRLLLSNKIAASEKRNSDTRLCMKRRTVQVPTNVRHSHIVWQQSPVQGSLSKKR